MSKVNPNSILQTKISKFLGFTLDIFGTTDNESLLNSFTIYVDNRALIIWSKHFVLGHFQNGMGGLINKVAKILL